VKAAVPISPGDMKEVKFKFGLGVFEILSLGLNMIYRGAGGRLPTGTGATGRRCVGRAL
jgi:hypothetical protein